MPLWPERFELFEFFEDVFNLLLRQGKECLQLQISYVFIGHAELEAYV